ncbi:MAG: C10 family peptidase, partial [Bacteroidales bacterium]|nr:C10 family peptidase [Bacteroidales bacterium]
MKKVIFVSLFISAFLSVVGQSIDENTALVVAKNFYQQYNHQKSNALQLYYAKTDNKLQKSGEKTTYYYIFNDGNEGFVVVAGDQRAMPVLGYSTESAFDTAGMPDNIRDWFKGYEEEIAYAIANIAEQPQENADWWQAYINNDIKPTQKATMDVSPLCSTTWDQIAPYNQLCPYDDSSSTRTVVGCVATAMAQIMKFWNFPTNGIGSHSYTHSKYGTLSANFANTTYQWTSMPNKVTTTSTTTAKTAVATLMYHCGVAVNMNYNTAANGGSAASTLLSSSYIQQGYIDAVTAFVRFFGYAAQGYYKSNYTDANWIAMLKTELDAGRPVMYAGQGTKGGHAFVCDGYNSNNYFHFNWGWSGKSDGDFLLTALNPGSLGTGGGSGGFNSSQKLVTIYPNLVDLKHYGRMLLAQSDNGRVL